MLGCWPSLQVNSVQFSNLDQNLVVTASNDWTARMCDIRKLSSSTADAKSKSEHIHKQLFHHMHGLKIPVLSSGIAFANAHQVREISQSILHTQFPTKTY